MEVYDELKGEMWGLAEELGVDLKSRELEQPSVMLLPPLVKFVRRESTRFEVWTKDADDRGSGYTAFYLTKQRKPVIRGVSQFHTDYGRVKTRGFRTDSRHFVLREPGRDMRMPIYTPGFALRSEVRPVPFVVRDYTTVANYDLDGQMREIIVDLETHRYARYKTEGGSLRFDTLESDTIEEREGTSVVANKGSFGWFRPSRGNDQIYRFPLRVEPVDNSFTVSFNLFGANFMEHVPARVDIVKEASRLRSVVGGEPLLLMR